MACKFAKNFIFFRRLMAWRSTVCMYQVCIYAGCAMVTRQGGQRRVEDGGSPALVDSHVSWLCSFPPPRARPTRPTLCTIVLQVAQTWFRLCLLLCRGVRVHGSMRVANKFQKHLSISQSNAPPHHASRRVRPPATIGRWLVVLAGVRAKKLLFFSCLDP